MLNEKDLLLQFLNMQKKSLKKEKKKYEKMLEPFKGFCYNDLLSGVFRIAQLQFEQAINMTDDYSLILPSQTIDAFGANIEGESTNKNLIEALDMVAKDKIFSREIENILTRLKLMVKKNFSAPKNGQVFEKLFARLYREASICNKKKDIKENNYIETIKELGLLLAQKYASLYSCIKKYEEATKMLDEMVLLVSEDRVMDFNDEKEEIIDKYFVLSDSERNNFSVIKAYNDKLLFELKMEDEKDIKLSLNSPEYIKILKDMNGSINERKSYYNDFLEDMEKLLKTNDFDEEKIVDKMKTIIINVKKDKSNSELLIKILKSMLDNNPSYPGFLKVIKPVLGYQIPISKKIIREPSSFYEIINIFEQFGIVLNNKVLCNKKAILTFESVLTEVATEMIKVAKRASLNKKKYELTYIDLKRIINGLETNSIISLIDEQNLRETNLGFDENTPKDAREFIPSLLEEIKVFNKKIELEKIKKSKTSAKRLRTSVVKKMKAKGLFDASKMLEEKISKVEDELVLLMLDYLLDEELEKVYNSGSNDIEFYDGDILEYYHDLCRLSLDCTNYLREKGIYCDSESIKDKMKI